MSPLTNASPAKMAAADTAVLQTHRTILVAEDSLDSREMMQVLLRMKGYRVLTAFDGVQALETALAEMPDLILMDLRLPRLDGLTVTRNLRMHAKMQGIPIVIVTGYEASRYGEAALDAGCDDYLMKPLDFDRLETLLRKFVPLALANPV